MDAKTAIVFFLIGMGQGAILLDWFRDKQTLKAFGQHEKSKKNKVKA